MLALFDNFNYLINKHHFSTSFMCSFIEALWHVLLTVETKSNVVCMIESVISRYTNTRIITFTWSMASPFYTHRTQPTHFSILAQAINWIARTLSLSDLTARNIRTAWYEVTSIMYAPSLAFGNVSMLLHHGCTNMLFSFHCGMRQFQRQLAYTDSICLCDFRDSGMRQVLSSPIILRAT